MLLLFVGETARIAFYNLRTRFARMLKKKRNSKGSTGPDGVAEMVEDEELFPFLSWLEAHIKTRRAINNESKIGTSDYGNEDSDLDDTPVSFVHEESTSEGNNNFRPKKKIKLIKNKARLNHEISNTPAEVHVLQSIGAKLGRKSHTYDVSRHEDEIFGAFVISQLRQIPQSRKIVLKMQISNMLYNEVLATLPASDATFSLPLETPSTSGAYRSTHGIGLETHTITLPETSVTTVTLPPSAQPVQATITQPSVTQTLESNTIVPQTTQSSMTIPLEIQPSQATESTTQATVTLPNTVQPVQATIHRDSKQDIHPTWSRLHLQQQRHQESIN